MVKTHRWYAMLTTGNEMTHITKLAARQRTAKRTGRPQVVNCQMRVKPAAPLALNGETLISLVKYDCALQLLLTLSVIQNTLYRECMLNIYKVNKYTKLQHNNYKHV